MSSPQMLVGGHPCDRQRLVIRPGPRNPQDLAAAARLALPFHVERVRCALHDEQEIAPGDFE